MSKRNSVLMVFFVLGLLIAGFIFSQGGPYPSKTAPVTSDNIQNPAPYISPFAPAIYTDDFDGANDTIALKLRGYKVWYRGGGAQGPVATWFQGNSTVFSAFNGPATGYVAANYQIVNGANPIDSWLVLPYMSGGLQVGDSLYFYSRSPTASTFPDSIRVMVSAGDSVPEGSWTELGRFKVTTSGSWERKGFRSTLTGPNSRFAIRYCVVDGGPSGNNSDFIGIDALTIVRSSAPPTLTNRCIVLPTPGVNTNYVTVPFQSGMIGFTNITIEGWMKPGGTTTANTLLNKGGASFDYQLGCNATTMNPFFRAGTTIVIATSMTLTSGIWQHVAVTYDGTTVKFYKNGVMGFSQVQAATLGSSTNEIRIGRGNADAGSGGIDELRLWSVARTDVQIGADMCNKWVPNNATGLKAKWHFDSTYTDSVSGWNGSPLGTVTFDTVTWCPITGVQQIGSTVPKEFSLQQNYPNPFNPTTTITFSLPKEGYVEMKLFDVTGKEVATLVSDPYKIGKYSVTFDASRLASGVYFYKITVGDFTATKKMVLIK